MCDTPRFMGGRAKRPSYAELAAIVVELRAEVVQLKARIVELEEKWRRRIPLSGWTIRIR